MNVCYDSISNLDLAGLAGSSRKYNPYVHVVLYNVYVYARASVYTIIKYVYIRTKTY